MKFCKVILSTLCMLLMVCTSFAFTGCDSNHTYAEIQTKYNDIVKEYTDVFFESDGDVNVKYNSNSLVSAITGSDINTQFNKLSKDSTKPNAIFEPTLKASLMVVKQYINAEYSKGTNFDKVQINELYDKLISFKDKLADLKQAKSMLENLSDFSVTGTAEKYLRDNLFTEYCETIDASCDFALSFANVYRNSIFVDSEYKQNERYSVGKMQMYYLIKLAEYAQITLNYEINLKYDQVINVSDQNTVCNQLLAQYNEVKDCTKWQGDTGEAITDDEKNVIDSFTSWVNYDSVFKLSKEQFLNSADNYKKVCSLVANSKSLTAEQQADYSKVNTLIYTDLVNMTSYIESFTTKLKTYLMV